MLSVRNQNESFVKPSSGGLFIGSKCTNHQYKPICDEIKSFDQYERSNWVKRMYLRPNLRCAAAVSGVIAHERTCDLIKGQSSFCGITALLKLFVCNSIIRMVDCISCSWPSHHFFPVSPENNYHFPLNPILQTL